MYADRLQRDWHAHKWNARRRNIPFLLTYEQWLDIWLQSGHLHERGNRKGQYVMARFEDTGPYSVNNVKIVTREINHAEKHYSQEFRKAVGERSAKLWIKKHQELMERIRWVEEWENKHVR